MAAAARSASLRPSRGPGYVTEAQAIACAWVFTQLRRREASLDPSPEPSEPAQPREDTWDCSPGRPRLRAGAATTRIMPGSPSARVAADRRAAVAAAFTGPAGPRHRAQQGTPRAQPG